MNTSMGSFFAMGGYGLYVWGSLGMCAVAMAIELLMLRTRQRHLDQEAQSAGRSPTGPAA